MEEKIIQEDPKQPNSSKQLQEKFKTLEKDYRSFTQSFSRIKPLKKCCGRTNYCSIQHQLWLLDSSPRHLMSSLQRHKKRFVSSSPFSSPVTVTVSGEVWRMRENELAKEEQQRERNRVIESRELKGRRLFVSDSEVDFDEVDEFHTLIGSDGGKFDEREPVCSGIFDKSDKRERDLGFLEKGLKGVRLFDDENEVVIEGNDEIQSICSSISGEFDQKEAREGRQGKLYFRGTCICSEREGRETEEREAGERESFVENGGHRVIRLRMAKLCLVVVVIVAFVAFVLGIIGGLGGFGFGIEEKVILIPT